MPYALTQNLVHPLGSQRRLYQIAQSHRTDKRRQSRILAPLLGSLNAESAERLCTPGIQVWVPWDTTRREYANGRGGAGNGVPVEGGRTTHLVCPDVHAACTLVPHVV